MANRNNSGRSRKPHIYRPYDPSNSFVKRLTAKVSEILPQPTSWVGRLFSSGTTPPKLNVRDRGDELDPEEEEDEEERQPPSKRLCFSTTETNDYSHQNNVSLLEREEGELSPIPLAGGVSSRLGGGAVSSRSRGGQESRTEQEEVEPEDTSRPGPSGLSGQHLRFRRTFPVASTPAAGAGGGFRAAPPLPAPPGGISTITPPSVVRGGRGGPSERRGVDGGEEGSDESGSTSGCSSLIPGAAAAGAGGTGSRGRAVQSERGLQGMAPASQPASHSAAGPSVSPLRAGQSRRLSLSAATAGNRTSNSSLNRSSLLNLSSSSQPAFDTYVFNNPLDRSGYRKRLLGDESNSSFYQGSTTYGGSSALTVQDTTSTLSGSSHPSPLVVRVQPSPGKSASSQPDTIGSSALKILRALEHFSTPVLDVKRMPVKRGLGGGSGGPLGRRGERRTQPYEELTFLSTTDLLRVKRREREQRAAAAAAATSEAASTSSSPAPTPAAASSSTTTSQLHQPPVGGGSGTSQQSTSQSSFPTTSSQSHSSRLDGGGSIKSSRWIEWSNPEPVNLPNVELPISNLPKLDLQPSSTEQQRKDNRRHDVQSSSGAIIKHQQQSPPFKFSQPDLPKLSSSSSKSDTKRLSVNKFSFSEPLDPKDAQNTPEEESQVDSSKPLPPEHQMKNPSPNFKLKRKIAPNTQILNFTFSSKSTEETKPQTNDKSYLSKSVESPKSPADSSTSCIECFLSKKCSKCDKSKRSVTSQSSVTFWDCLKCSLKNSDSDEKCKSCGLKKGENPNNNVFKGFSKPKDTWECKECYVNNKNADETCVACSTPKVGGKPPVSNSMPKFSSEQKVTEMNALPKLPLISKSGKSDGSWECDTCLVRNKKDEIKCVACSTLKPGAQAPVTFSFGIPSSSAPGLKSFSTSNAEQKSSQPTFTFGIPSDSALSKSNSAPSTLFGAEKLEVSSAPSLSTTVTSSTTVSSSTTPLVNCLKKAEGSWECGTCLVQNKKETTSCVACSTPKPGCQTSPVEKPKPPTFSFGIPSTTSTAVSAIASSASTASGITSSSNPLTSTFGNIPSDKQPAPAAPLFNFNASTTPANPPSTDKVKTFSFMNSDSSTDKAGVKTNLFTFGNANNIQMSKSEDMNDDDEKPAKKRVTFGFPLTSEKSMSNDSNSVVPFTATKPNEAAPTSNFAFTPFGSNAVVPSTTSNSLFSFGTASSAAPKENSLMSAPVKPMTFGGTSNNALQNSGSSPAPSLGSTPSLGGGFKMSTSPPESKPFAFLSNSNSGGFSFNSTSAGGVTAGNAVGSQEMSTGQQPGNNLAFGQTQQAAAPPATSSLFSQQQTQQEPKPFLFNAPTPATQPSQPQTLFSMNPTPAQTAPGAPPSGGGGFNFSAASTLKFDPNVKPTFNFTGGATPSFNAAPSSVVAERKMKRGIRRVTNR